MSSLRTKELEAALSEKKYDLAFSMATRDMGFQEIRLILMHEGCPDHFKEKVLKAFSQKPIRNRGEYEAFAYNFSMFISTLWAEVRGEKKYALKCLKDLHEKTFQAAGKNFTTGYIGNFFTAFEENHPGISWIPQDPSKIGVHKEDLMMASKPNKYSYLMSKFGIDSNDGEEKDFSGAVPALEPA